MVYQWLAALKKIKNPLYKDKPELPDLESVWDSLTTTINSLINESINTFDSDALERTEVKKDDVAGIRASSDPYHELSDLCGKKISLQVALALTHFHIYAIVANSKNRKRFV